MQTAVEWLIDQMFKQGYFDGNKPFSFTNLDHLQHQAKEMEKQQIIDAREDGIYSALNGKDIDYYNETYGSKDIALQNQLESKVITELSDEEIEKILFHHSNEYAYGFKDAIKWYREQLKNK